MESKGNVTPTNSPTSTLQRIPACRESKQSPPRMPNIRILCESFQLLFSKTVCPNCEEMLTSPVRFCSSGHCFCGKCQPWMTLCTTCFKPLTNIPNKNLDDILTLTSFNCPGESKGCSEKMPLSLITDHLKHCDFNLFQCPVGRIKDMKCLWYGLKKDFPSHVKSHVNWHIPFPGHNNFLDRFTIVWKPKPECAFICVEDEIFMYSRRLFRDKWVCILQQVGMTRRKYECVFYLEGINGFDHIRTTQVVRRTENSFMQEFSSGRCFRMPERMIRHFIEDDYLNMMIYINDVTKPTDL
jgi:hypothetical protein